jgi:hypothetical protein
MLKNKDEFPDYGHFEPYKHFASQLRTWLIAYGIGAPVLFVSQPSIANALKTSNYGRTVFILFLIGVVLQIVETWLYKFAMWYLYLGELNDSFRNTKRHKASEWIAERFWPELVIDVSSIALFSLATFKALTTVIK